MRSTFTVSQYANDCFYFKWEMVQDKMLYGNSLQTESLWKQTQTGRKAKTVTGTAELGQVKFLKVPM